MKSDENKSSITVGDLINNYSLCPIRVIYGWSTIYDDTGDELFDITDQYKDLIVYNFYAQVVDYHHTILEINTTEI